MRSARIVHFGLAALSTSALGGCLLLAELSDHHAATTGLVDGGTSGEGGPGGEAGDDTLEIAISPTTLTVLPGDLVNIEVRAIKRPAGAIVKLRVDGPGFVAALPDGRTDPTGALPDLLDTRDRRSVLLRTDPDAAAGSEGTATITASVTQKKLVHTQKIVVKMASLDTKFSGGIVTANLDTSKPIDDYIAALLLQADGNFVGVATGYPGNDGQGDVYVGRFLSTTGQLDTSLNLAGYYRYDNGSFANQVVQGAAFAGTKIVTVGRIDGGPSKYQHEVHRFNADLTHDTSFNSAGVVYLGGTSDDAAYSVVADTSGKILVGGYVDGLNSATLDSSTLALQRLNVNGTADASFGTNGTARFSGAEFSRSVPWGLVLGTGNEPIMAVSSAGIGSTYVNNQLLLARATSAGGLKSGFGKDGVARTPIASTPTSDLARGVVVQKDGKIVVVGASYDPQRDYDVVLARYSPDGALDTTFGAGGSGYVVTDLTQGSEIGTAIALDSAENIVVLANVGGTSMAVLRYNSSGVLTSSYGPGGYRRAVMGTSLVVQKDDKIVVGGWVVGPGPTSYRDSALVRLLP